MSRPDQGQGETDNRRLAALFALEDQAAESWDASDLAALLRHQLEAPVEVDLGALPPDVAPKVRALAGAEGLTLRSFHDLFQHPHPPVALLRMVKDFAKLNRAHSRSALPPEVALVLYYAAIVAAALRCRQAISGLEPAQLRKGIEWTLGQPWLDPTLRPLFQEAQKRLVGREPGAQDQSV